MAAPEPPFFIGWSKTPARLRDFVIGVGFGIVVLLAMAGFMVAATQNDPGDGAFVGGAEAVGILTAKPYPVLQVTESAAFPAGTALLLSGVGKRGVADRAAPLDGGLVALKGVRIARGEIEQLQVDPGADGMVKAANAAPGPGPVPVDLGRWRIAGEICDGKCVAGAMRPGTGLAHKACANLCLIGGAPPVFVATTRVDGAQFFLLGNADGGPVSDEVLDHTAVLVEAEGRIERRGGMHVFLIDPASVRLAR